MSNYVNLFGGVRLLSNWEDMEGYENFEEWAISMPVFDFFMSALNTGKVACTVKAFKECNLEDINVRLELAYHAICNYIVAENGTDKTERANTCKEAMACARKLLHGMGVVEGGASTVLTVSQWGLVKNAVSYKAGKGVRELSFSSLAMFKKAVMVGLLCNASGVDGFKFDNTEKVEKAKAKLEKLVSKKLDVVPTF